MRAACQVCGSGLERVVADLGTTPLANSYLTEADVDGMEPYFPLRALVCDECLLVQLKAYRSADSIFSDYAYFSSYSTSWLEHARRYVEEIVRRYGLDAASRVVEIASNDGYLLQYLQAACIPAEGVEPARNVAAAAIDRGIPTTVDFFGRRVARELLDAAGPADLIIANNVLAHTPTVSDVLAGVAILLAPNGTLTAEFQHLQRLLERGEFDTIYHEHFCYFTLLSFEHALEPHGLAVVDVEELPTHGGSLRVHVAHAEADRAPGESVAAVRAAEVATGLNTPVTYEEFAQRVRSEKRAIVRFLHDLKEDGCSIAAYGAPAKGNTLLNYCGIGTDVIDFTVDRNPRKQGTYLPGSHIPVLAPEAIDDARPDVVLILPWNLREEIMDQLAHVRQWGGRFAARAPELRLYD
jgi:hypothetical protein